MDYENDKINVEFDYEEDEKIEIEAETFAQAVIIAVQPQNQVHSPYKELESEIVVIENIIQAFILKETKLLEQRDAFKRIIRYEDKIELTKRLGVRYSAHQLDRLSEENLRESIMTELENKLHLDDITKGIRLLRSAKDQLVLSKRSLFDFK